MDTSIHSVEYYNVVVTDLPGESYRLLEHLAAEGVNLLAFNAIPLGPAQTHLVLFPEDPERFVEAASKKGLHLGGPLRAFLIQGDDRLGALVDIHRKLCEVRVKVHGSTGVTDGRGGFGYVLYVGTDQFETAAHALGV